MKVSANVSGRKMFPITIHFNNGDQHLTVDAAKELSEKLVEAIEWVKPEGARELIDKQEELIKEMREYINGLPNEVTDGTKAISILEKTKEYVE